MMRERRLGRQGRVERGFTLRGESVSRLEAFSDAVFGLAVTLVIVTDYGGGGGSFNQILRRMEGVLSIGACFATLYAIWGRHYDFCRRFGLEDMVVRVLTGILVFVVALYAYPLKAVFELAFGNFLSLGPPSTMQISVDQVPLLMLLYGAGWTTVNLIFAALYVHSYRQREILSLSRTEASLTRVEAWQFLASALVGVFAIGLAYALPRAYAGLSGFAYCLMAVVGVVAGHFSGEVRKRAPTPHGEGPADEPVAV